MRRWLTTFTRACLTAAIIVGLSAWYVCTQSPVNGQGSPVVGVGVPPGTVISGTGTAFPGTVQSPGLIGVANTGVNPEVALTLCNLGAVSPSTACGTNKTTIQIDQDGSYWMKAFAGGVEKAAVQGDTSPWIKMYLSTLSGFAADNNGNVCVSTGQLSAPTYLCGDAHTTAWNNSGQLTKVKGAGIQNGSVTGSPYGVPTLFSSGNVIGSSLTCTDGGAAPCVQSFSIGTTNAGTGNNDNATPNAAGVYVYYWAMRATAANAGETATVTISCNGDDGVSRPWASQGAPQAFAAANAVASGEVIAYCNRSATLTENFTFAGYAGSHSTSYVPYALSYGNQ